MLKNSTLPTPELPQMSNDGYITEVELDSNAGVVIEVAQYPLAAKGDYLSMYWDGRPVAYLSLDDPDTYAWPWRVVVDYTTDPLPDGPHQAWYSVVDIAINPAVSPDACAIIDRNHTDGLPPPTFPDRDAYNTITYDSVIQNNGTHVAVPWSTDAWLANDLVYVYWRELDSAGMAVPESETSVTHTITASDVGSDFQVLIASSYVAAIATNGSAESWYSVVPLTGMAQSSQTGMVNIDMSGSGSYPAPFIPEGNDGWIDCSEITVEGVEIDVPGNTQFVAGGTVTVYWQGTNATGAAIVGTYWPSPLHTLTASEVSSGFSVMVPAAYVMPIGIGFAQAWYVANDPAVPGVSGTVQVQVDTTHCTLLPAPLFPSAAGDNTITGDEVTADNGTDMTVSWQGMAVGDAVTAFWVGYLISPDTPVPGATWTSTYTLSSTDVQAGEVVFHIPAGNISPVGNGFGEGKYQVMFNSSGIASSAVTVVNLSISKSSALTINCATSAPYFDPGITVRPLNIVTLSGTPGIRVELSLPSTSRAYFYIEGSDPTQILWLTLNQNGRGSAQVYNFDTGNIQVVATNIVDPTDITSGSMVFNNWTPVNIGDLESYGISTSATADGLSTCEVYVQTVVDPRATQVKLELTGKTSAIISVSGSTIALIDISTTDYAAGFDITDTAAEFVSFTLSLPDTGAYVTGQLVFSSPLSESAGTQDYIYSGVINDF